MERFGQFFFEFNQWKEALSFWKENIHLYEGRMRLVVSTDKYTSGYWIEGVEYELGRCCKVYSTDAQVDALMKRVEEMAASHQTHLVL